MKKTNIIEDENWKFITGKLSLNKKNEVAKFIWKQLSDKLHEVLKESEFSDKTVEAVYEATLIFTVEVLIKMSQASKLPIEGFCERFIENIIDAFRLNYEYQSRTEEDEYYIKQFELDKKSKS